VRSLAERLVKITTINSSRKSMNISSPLNNSNGILISENMAVSHTLALAMVSSVSSDGSADSIISVRPSRSHGMQIGLDRKKTWKNFALLRQFNFFHQSFTYQ